MPVQEQEAAGADPGILGVVAVYCSLVFGPGVGDRQRSMLVGVLEI